MAGIAITKAFVAGFTVVISGNQKQLTTLFREQCHAPLANLA